MQEHVDVRIHPTAEISPLAEIGAGTSIWNNCQIRENARIGGRCILGKDVYVDFDVQIGEDVKIQNGALIYHGVTLESGVFVGPGVIFTNDKEPRAINPDGSLKAAMDWAISPTLVQYGASLGAGAVILSGLQIGRFAMVGAGAVVTRDVPNHALVVGNPARMIGYVCKCAARLARLSPGRYQCPQCDEEYQLEERSF